MGGQGGEAHIHGFGIAVVAVCTLVAGILYTFLRDGEVEYDDPPRGATIALDNRIVGKVTDPAKRFVIEHVNRGKHKVHVELADGTQFDAEIHVGPMGRASFRTPEKRIAKNSSIEYDSGSPTGQPPGTAESPPTTSTTGSELPGGGEEIRCDIGAEPYSNGKFPPNTVLTIRYRYEDPKGRIDRFPPGSAGGGKGNYSESGRALELLAILPSAATPGMGERRLADSSGAVTKFIQPEGLHRSWSHTLTSKRMSATCSQSGPDSPTECRVSLSWNDDEKPTVYAGRCLTAAPESPTF